MTDMPDPEFAMRLSRARRLARLIETVALDAPSADAGDHLETVEALAVALDLCLADAVIAAAGDDRDAAPQDV